MGTTATYLLPYPELDEPDDVPADVKQLADRLELVLPTFEQIVRKGAPNGYAALGADGRVPTAQLPPQTPITVLRKTSQTDIVNNNTPRQDLLNGEISVPANALTPTGKIAFDSGGDYLNSSGSNRSLVFAVLLGGQPLWDSNAVLIASATGRRSWRFHGTIHSIDATHVRLTGTFSLGTDVAGTTGSGIGNTQSSNIYLSFPMGPSVVVAPTAAMPLLFAITHQAAAATSSMRLNVARFEVS